MRKFAVLLLIGFQATILSAQDFSNKGKDFWLGYGYHVNMSNGSGGILATGGSQDMVLYFTSDKNANVTVEIPGVNYTRTYTVAANQVTETAPLPKTGAQDARISGTGFFNTGIHVYSDVPIVAYAHIYNASISGASLLFPTTTLGKDYYSINYTQSSNATFANSFFFVVATEDNTAIEITPSAVNKNGLTPGQPFITTLNKGQIYSVMGTTSGTLGTDLTGSRIRSISSGSTGCKKIAVFSGSGKMSIGGTNQNGSADNLFAQAFPASAWGKRYLTAPTGSQPNNFYRICVSDPSTVVKLNGNILPVSSLRNNFYYEFKNGNASGTNPAVPNLIESDKSIIVAQYCTTQGTEGNPGNPGDPEMIYLSPVEQTINSITLNSTSHFLITQHFINVIIKNGGVNSFKLDGVSKTASFQSHPQDNNYSYAIFSVTAGTHSVYSDTGFNAIAYGFGNAESYGYNAGTNVQDLLQYLTINNQGTVVNFPATCRQTPFNFIITLPYQTTQLNWDFGNNSDISPNTAVNITSPVPDSSYVKDGRTLYVYKLSGLYTIAKTGIYPIKITANNPTPDGCSGVQEINYDLQVFEKPSANFSFTSSGCVSDSVSFTDKSASNDASRNIGQWQWDFGNGSFSTQQNQAVLFGAPGLYSVKQTITTDIGCIADTTQTVNLSSKPVISFTSSQPACINGTIQFTDHSTIASGNIVSWKWDYANGNTDSLSNNSVRSQVYNSAGNYPVKLTLQTNTGCIATDSIQLVIHDKPVVKFVLPEVCLADAFALFTDSSSIADHTESQFNYLWNFGDRNSTAANNTSTVQNPQHKYTQSAVYNVTLRVTSGAGCIDSLMQAFTVNGSIPKADFSFANAAKVCSNKDVVIKDLSTVDFGSITKVEIIWDNANNPSIIQKDDNPVPGKTYAHAYPSFNTPASKTYQILYKSYSGGVCVNGITKNITIYSTPLLSFSALQGICNEAQPISITQAQETANNPGSFAYSGNGISSAGIFNPVQAGAGTWPIKYTYTTNDGCVDSISKNITVWPSPAAKFGVSSPVCEKNTIIFSDSSVANYSNIKTWNWNFNDGTTAIRNTPASFNKTYTAAGNYQVSLQVTTDSGCTNTVTKPVIVHPLPVVDFTMPAGVCLPDGRAQFNDQSSIADHTENSFSYYWTFGDANDNTPSLQKNPVHTYSTTGSKTIWLRITSKDGCVDSLTKTFDKIFPQPQSDFSAIPTEVCVGQPIQFTDKSDGKTSAVTQWQWQMGNGANFTSQNVSYTFLQTGTFQVQLQITNQQSCPGTIAKQTVIIHPYPTVYAGPDLKILEGGSDTINAIASGNQLIYKWTPPYGLSSDTVLQPVVTPPKDQVYTLKVTGEGNCSVTDEVAIVVLKMPLPPNAFSPNADGINDTWIIKYLDTYPGCTVDIFDRYGQAIFHSTGYSVPWDGNYKGKPLPIGTYYYIIDPKNGRKAFTGYVIILK